MRHKSLVSGNLWRPWNKAGEISTNANAWLGLRAQTWRISLGKIATRGLQSASSPWQAKTRGMAT